MYRKPSHGLTQIEFVTMLTVLSTLSAVALPKMSDLSGEARRATLMHLAGTLTQASVLNAARGQLRANADLVSHCQDAGPLIVNASMQDDRMRWQERDLRLSNAGEAEPSAVYRECVLSDVQAPSMEPVRFFIRRCTDRHCGEA
ncbi:MAG: Tfp pilus assembly protein FimT/FimU [Burkholderiales bacterium]